MNSILENKLNKLNEANDYECWYLVKQPTGFDNLCYLVSFLEKYKNTTQNKNLETYISEQLTGVHSLKPDLKFSDNYRALRVAAFFGLITMKSSKYNESVITDAFKEITTRCNGEYEKTELYNDIIQRQIEKMFISSEIDEERDKVRHRYRLYPVMLLYKVLIELGRSTGKYEISMTEYRYFVATTEVFEDFLETLLLIKLLRYETEETIEEFEKYRKKFDNRLILALRQLDTLEFDRDYIRIKEDKIQEVAKKVFAFEDNPKIFTTSNYLGFLGSTKSLFELDDFETYAKDNSIENNSTNKDEINNKTVPIVTGRNLLLYGVPGAGKSYEIDNIIVQERSERIVFHPDYTYSDFVGQILPRIIITDDAPEGKLRYVFEPGPFSKILKNAIDDPNNMYFLVIEEINRGNAPAIFGDIFQLLDRNDDGVGKYRISNYDVAKSVYGEGHETDKIRMPANLTLLATMNTSDQNVFTLDTAFQRRWEMHLINNDVYKAEHAGEKIEGSEISWGKFADITNREIIRFGEETGNSEDKRLGAYFARSNELVKGIFPEKVLKYLWDDAFKMDHYTYFNENISSLDDIIDIFRAPRIEKDVLEMVLKQAIYQKMNEPVARSEEIGESAENIEMEEKKNDK